VRRRKRLGLHREAEVEIAEATDHYESERRDLGADFEAALHATLDRIARFPASFATVMKDRDGHAVRRAFVDPFSYKVVYVELPKLVLVIAVSHTKRRSYYWRRRLREK
jgi:hypothetical protein